MAAQDSRPVFRTGVSQVSLNIVVKDRRGRPISDLLLKDFEVFDQGRPVPLRDFRSGVEPVSIAVLIDTSGSMRMGTRLEAAKQAAGMLIDLFGAVDEAALFTFDRNLSEVVPFSTDLAKFRSELERVRPFGQTSLHDAVAATAQTLASRSSSRRAVVAITDGLDNSSDLTAPAASSLASLSDVPVYVLSVARSDRATSLANLVFEPLEGGGAAQLDALTAPTGGASFDAETVAQALPAVRSILTDLRTGYVVAFTPGDTPGWHELTVRVARKEVRVRTRAGFWVGAAATASR
jgi:VWFA-related protein